MLRGLICGGEAVIFGSVLVVWRVQRLERFELRMALARVVF